MCPVRLKHYMRNTGKRKINRRGFLKLLGFGISAVALVRPKIKEPELTTEPEIVKDAVPLWTGTNGTLSTATWSRVWLDDGGKIVYYPHPWKAIHKNLTFDKGAGVWNTYTEVR